MFSIVFIASLLLTAFAASKDKPHGHQGALEAFSGKPLPFKVTGDQEKKLANGDAITFNERSGKSGRGVVITDINASTTICMNKIKDLSIYPKVVPSVKKVDIYERINHRNGTAKSAARFDIGVMGMRFGYYLMLTHEPKYNTFTWTLDYRYNSDFDDNVGHWQVMKHPTKAGWARVLYSTKVKLFPWIPEMVVNFLTKKALTDSTSWVKRESEAEQKKESEAAQMRLKAVKNPFGTLENPFANSNIQLPSWMNIKGGQKSTSTSTSEEGENKKFPFGFLSHMRVLPFLRINRAGMC